MKYWLIGCGILLLIVIVLGVFTVHYFVTHFQEMKQEFEEVAAEYHELEAAYPFKKPTDNIVTTVQMGRFVRCRKELAYGVQEMLDRFEDEETSGLDKLGMLFNMVMARRADRSKMIRRLDTRAAALHEMGRCNPARSQQMSYAARELRAAMKDLM